MTASRAARPNGIVGTVARVIALGLVSVLAVASPALAQDGLDEVGRTTWEVRPSAGVVDVTIQLTLRNDTPDTPEGRTYFDGYGIGLPMEPTSVEVRSEGEVVGHEPTTLDDGVPGITWAFPERLYNDQSRTFRIDVRFASAPPRSDITQGPRVTQTFVMVPVWAWGADDADLVVRVPVDLDAHLGLVEPTDVRGSTAVFRREDATTFSEFLVGASDEVDRTSESVPVDGTTVEVEAWPDDPEWGRKVGAFAREALPALADWTGTDWQEDRLVIRETARPVAEGWAGWNDPDANVISVGEDFDRGLWTHELSHNWFDASEFSDEWLREGLAETVTTQLADELRIREPAPARPTDLPLSEWRDIVVRADPAVGEDPVGWYETTDELYAGAHHVVGTVADEVGQETFRKMVRMTLAEESAWGDLGTAVPNSAADWREFLDLAEQVGGSRKARNVVLDQVIPDDLVPQTRERLAARDRAIERREALADDPWGVPTTINADMHVWRFDEVEAGVTEALAVRERTHALVARADGMGQDLPDLRQDWIDGSFTTLGRRVDTLEAVLDDLAALDRQVERADLPPPALDVDTSTDDVTTVTARIEAARGAVARLVGAEQALDRVADDPVAEVGLAGDDPAALRDRARDALRDGEVDEVVAATGELDELVAGATDRGRQRLGAGAIAALFVVGLIVALVAWRRRRIRAAP